MIDRLDPGTLVAVEGLVCLVLQHQPQFELTDRWASYNVLVADPQHQRYECYMLVPQNRLQDSGYICSITYDIVSRLHTTLVSGAFQVLVIPTDPCRQDSHQGPTVNRDDASGVG